MAVLRLAAGYRDSARAAELAAALPPYKDERKFKLSTMFAGSDVTGRVLKGAAAEVAKRRLGIPPPTKFAEPAAPLALRVPASTRALAQVGSNIVMTHLATAHNDRHPFLTTKR